MVKKIIFAMFLAMMFMMNKMALECEIPILFLMTMGFTIAALIVFPYRKFFNGR